MNRKKRCKSLVVAAALLALAAVAAGCGGANPPCQTDIAAVDTARKSAMDADAQRADLERQRAQAQQEIAAEEARQSELAQHKAELEAKLAETAK